MLVANILATLEQASLSKAVMTVQCVNGTPSLILSFIADGATVTDSQKVMELRKTLAQPLVVTGQDLEEQLVGHLGHSADELISITTDLKKEQGSKAKNQPKQKANTASSKGATVTKSPESTATDTATNQESIQADQTPAAVDEPAQNAAQQVSQISMSDFSL
ncbi:hypothetical protein F0267_02100 [Vibrio coralliilyticus]|uniref:PRTRC system protein E n=2 Tax=Vibrio TaxID=662 RepID=A0AAN0SI18_9VIBR|nr:MULTISPECIES: hypothetical protein [Vibrio]AIW22456.1 hypothetical protein IX92_25665 [Vibrio coralliilyticus]MCZ2799117.1 hypothetical protein [Vibrio alginolyticus]NOH37018.1 hypothetical protein [Vibrio coralliilyticus]POB47274.1 hypothetical protein CRN52_14430 [Vibrio vulnificus]